MENKNKKIANTLLLTGGGFAKLRGGGATATQPSQFCKTAAPLYAMWETEQRELAAEN